MDLARIPRERDTTLAFVWPEGLAVTRAGVPGVRFDSVPDRAAFVAVQEAIGFVVTDAIWEGLRFTRMVVARIGGSPVAVACAEPRPEGWTELSWVAVAPACRGRGLGAAVCAEIVDWLVANGYRDIVGSTQDANLHALRIYLSLGFVPVERPEKRARWQAVLAALGHGGPAMH
ncbi:MAG: GNAT family N-acetyltransferase [Alphaproteobacteria bacterium]|nr:GNAT family N-acetyltransferase [Alphaproteobacteria bacterium]